MDLDTATLVCLRSTYWYVRDQWSRTGDNFYLLMLYWIERQLTDMCAEEPC